MIHFCNLTWQIQLAIIIAIVVILVTFKEVISLYFTKRFTKANLKDFARFNMNNSFKYSKHNEDYFVYKNFEDWLNRQ